MVEERVRWVNSLITVVYCLWFVVCGFLFIVCGLWFAVCDSWFFGCDCGLKRVVVWMAKKRER